MYTLCSSDKYSTELVTNQVPPLPGLQVSDLSCMLQLSSELNQVEKEPTHTYMFYIYVCVCVCTHLSSLGDLENVSLIKKKVNANTEVGRTGPIGLLRSLYS